MELIELLEPVIKLASEAGKAIAAIYESGDFEALEKSDDTPVTTADLAANDIIMAGLQQLAVSYPIQSEEEEILPLAEREHWHRYWLIDPLDGTGEFIQRSGDFAVNIALIENNQPVMGVIFAPISGVVYAAVKGKCVFKRDAKGTQTDISARKLAGEDIGKLRFAISRRQKLEVITDCIPSDLPTEFIPFGSSTLKSCMVAEGAADCYVRFGPTGEWDTGAAECIVREAGGTVTNLALEPLSYNERESLENPNFMVVADADYPWGDVIRYR
ncbi:3'(2'),5'-bisphosphate nucleotidase CysQ [Echinimonas agarilytica]|uniref:3'(2'),5'-bisphosphate nucleotidase CysQ n=1 Tax=Echinimonas agarilytica TaxID=1215918 RepID=A0AA41W8Y0_9GAMM|nr:3'(2'),5'-bisphosphate nucleotidase CysQ [Echinimonas agarilytica]MCM2680881.1 3'(2'),5'-bisphosphate nucleotidase CysQ [Echinimonas agarilytica]